MASTRNALQHVAANLDESMGVRQVDLKPQFSPVASTKDLGRKPLRKFGRLSVEQIIPDPSQPRTEFDEEDIQHLAASLKSTGQLHPIRVRWDLQAEKWIIITGERRYRATQAAGLTEIDCYFHDDEITEAEILEQQLVENLLRENLKPLEEAKGYSALMEVNGWNGKQVAEALNVSPSKVSRALALLDLPERIRQQIESGEISRTSAYELSKLNNEDIQHKLTEQAAQIPLTQKRTVKVVRERRGKLSRQRGLRQVFQAENGLKVTVTARQKVNYHEIEQALTEALEEVQLRIQNNVQVL